jgi:cytoskeletal protein CcmA (bactofilin family)
MNQLRRSRAEVADDEPDRRVSSAGPARPIDRSGQSTREEGAVRKLVVGREITLSGAIKSCDKLIIEGTIEGNLTDCQDVEICESGAFTGSAVSEEAEIAGHFDGNLIVRKRLLIRASGCVSGIIRYGQIQIEAGGRISGDISAQPISEDSEDPAEAMGRSLQAAFGRATKAAVSEAHKAGLSVPGRRADRAVEITPNGREQTIDETGFWSPTDWKAGRHG